MGNNLMRLKVFPVLPHKDQKVKLSFTSVATQDNGLVEYIYPLKTDGKATKTLEEFSVKATIKSQHPIQNVYSPTHAITLTRNSDKEVAMTFERSQAMLDKDFQLFYSVGNKDIGLTPLFHRPISAEDGYFLLLISPQLEMSEGNGHSARHGARARHVRQHGQREDGTGPQGPEVLPEQSELGRPLRHRAIHHHRPQVPRQAGGREQRASRERQEVGGRLESRRRHRHQRRPRHGARTAHRDEGRTFTVVFFTDGQPTIGETKPETILKNVAKTNTKNTRIFTFGVGDDVNAALLDQLADNTKALSTYVRPAEDIETKVSSLYGKISHPVLANLRLTTSDERASSRDLSARPAGPVPRQPACRPWPVHRQRPGGGQADGQVGKETKEFVYEVNFAGEDRRRSRIRREPVGPPQGRLPARPDPHQRREEGTDGRDARPGQEVRHRDAVHELPGRAGRSRARDAHATGEGGTRKYAGGRRRTSREAHRVAGLVVSAVVALAAASAGEG